MQTQSRHKSKVARRGDPLIHSDDSMGCAFQFPEGVPLPFSLIWLLLFLIGCLEPVVAFRVVLRNDRRLPFVVDRRVGRRKLGNMVTPIVAYSRKTPTTPLTTPLDADLVIH